MIAELKKEVETLKLFQADICREQNTVYSKYAWCDEKVIINPK